MILELIRNGGVLALASVALGLAGVGMGVVALGARRNALAILTLFLAVDAAGAGIGGALYGQARVDQALESVNPVDGDRIRRIGYAEARGAALVGFGASLPALLLGTFALLRSRTKPTVVASLTQSREEDTTAVNASGFVFVAMAGLAAVGALVISQRPLPPARYDFDPEDRDAWELAAALTEDDCDRLERALKAYPEGRAMPASLSWKPAVKACVDRRAEEVTQKAPPLKEIFKEEETAELSRTAIAPVVKKAMGAIRGCYERGLKKNPRLEGKLLVQFEIAADGAVPSAVAAEPFFDDWVSECVMKQFRGLKFPAHGGATVKVKYPIVFTLPR